ncbi:class I SAM-dependent methyltransferase [Candidatus Omnitrophota bacterium]
MSEKVNLEYVNCDLCGGRDTQFVYKASTLRRETPGEFDLVKCKKCGLIYLNPRPDFASLAKFYPQDYEFHKIRKISFLERVYYKHFRNPGQPVGKILEVGCGNGNYLRLLKSLGWDCFGTEVNTDLVRHLNQDLGLKVSEGRLYELDFPQDYFDIVTFWGALEHMSSPLKNLTRAYKILKPGGRIIAWLQNIESLEARVFKNYWHHLEIPTHLYQFSQQTLRKMLQQAEFTIERVRFDPISMGIVPSIGYKLNALGLNVHLNNLILKIAALPLDLILSLFKSSGLITVYARK